MLVDDCVGLLIQSDRRRGVDGRKGGAKAKIWKWRCKRCGMESVNEMVDGGM